MPDVDRPDGATIHYETFGDGYPLLLLAPGGVNSQAGMWERSAINPIREFASDFRIIAMDQRHAGRSYAPAAPVSYGQLVADQLAVLDHAGAEHAHLMGGCIGVAYVLRMIQEAPERITAGVGQDPVGLDDSNSIGVFTAMFAPTIALARESGVGAVIEAARRDPMFVSNNAAGPFAARLNQDAAFRDEIGKLTTAQYIDLVQRFSDGLWPHGSAYFSVPESWLQTCQVPLLILPGNDPFHPAGISQRICREAPLAECLEPDCRSAARLPATIERVRAFLLANVPG